MAVAIVARYGLGPVLKVRSVSVSVSVLAEIAKSGKTESFPSFFTSSV